MEPLNSDTVAINSENKIADKLQTKIQVSSNQLKNVRRVQEDRFVVENDLNAAFDLDLPHKYRYYAIFDGHVTYQAADYCQNYLHLNLIQSEKFKNGEIKEALKEAFIKTDTDFCELTTNQSKQSGTTALVCLIEDDRRLYSASAGDSQSFLIRNGNPIQLNSVHKPEFEEERKRIEKMGGQCLYNQMWRVMGILAVSRSIGDPDYKPYVTAEPDVKEIELDGSEDFLIMASDGLWDEVRSEDAVEVIYEFLALNADKYNSTEEVNNELLDQVSKQLNKLSIERGSEDNTTTIVIFLKDLATISPPLKPIKENGQQNGCLNGHHENESTNEINLLQNDINGTKENGDKSFSLNVHATPFLPNIDLFSNIAMSSIESIRSMQEKACTHANINITSNEDNFYDNNLQCAINDKMSNFNENDEQPHSILPEINNQLINVQLSAKQVETNNSEDDLESELDKERLVINEDNEKLYELSEENETIQEQKSNEQKEVTKIDEKSNVETAKAIECEYGIIPTESIALPVDLISESTIDHNEYDDNEKSLDENLYSDSPFEQIDESHQSPAKQSDTIIKEEKQVDVVIKLNDETFYPSVEDNLIKEKELKINNQDNNSLDNLEVENKSHEEDEKSEENSFEFIEHQDIKSQPSQDQNITQYESPENSNLGKLIGLQEEFSVYENANPVFDNSILNRDLQYREQQLDEEEQVHPFENDSEDSIKYLNNTCADKQTNQMLTDANQQEQINKIDKLADQIVEININESNNENEENINDFNENVNDRTLNLLEDTQNQENIDDQNKENVPQLIKPQRPTLLDSTLVFNGNPPNIIPPTNDEQLARQSNEINENNSNDENQRSASCNLTTLSNFELHNEQKILDNEVTNEFEYSHDNQTNYKAFDMEITDCDRTEYTENLSNSQPNTEVFKEKNVTIKDDKTSNQENFLDSTKPILVTDEQIHEKVDKTLKNNLDEFSGEYEIESVDQSFIKVNKLEESKQNEDKLEFGIEKIAEEAKNNFVFVEMPVKSSFDNNLISDLNKDQLCELKPELNETINSEREKIEVDEKIVEEDKKKSISNGFEKVNGTSKKEKFETKLSSATKAAIAASSVLATNSNLVSKKSSSGPSATIKSSGKPKMTKDTKLAIAKDKSSSGLMKDTKTSTTKPTNTLLTSRISLTKKPITTAPKTTKSVSNVNRKPLTAATTKSVATVSSTRLIDIKKPILQTTSKSSAALIDKKPSVSKVSSNLKANIVSQSNIDTSNPKSVSKSSLKSKTNTTASDSKTNIKTKPAISRPAVSKYANVASKVSSNLTSSSNSTRTTIKSNDLETKKQVLNNPKSTITTKSLTSATNTLSTNATSKFPSTRSANNTNNTKSKVNSKSSTKSSTKLSTINNTKSSSLSSNLKTTAVPRKPVNGQSNNNVLINSAHKSSTQETSPQDQVVNNENNSNSIRPNSQLVGSQQMNNLSNGDALNQSVTISTSMTSSKSRDKLTNSLKAELEAAMLTEGLPK